MQKNNKNLTDTTSTHKGFLTDIIAYEAEDSITFDLKKQHFNIYGTSYITYGKTKLKADHILLEGNSSTIIARGKVNEDNTIKPKVILEHEGVTYVAEEIRYNVESNRGTAKRLFTQQDQAFIRCRKAKADTQNTYYADRVKFTTCNLTNPHYFVKARDVKFVKDDKIASGPFQFYFDGVPTIIGFFYGLFFIPKDKTSGVLAPQIGEDGKKGFFLRNGGYYFYFSDYMDLALRGSIYSKGHSDFLAESNYKKRYSFKGQLSYKQEITSNTAELALQEDKAKEWRLKWNNSTENDHIRSFMAEVDIQSRSKRHSLQKIGEPDNLNAETRSKVRYTRKKILGSSYSFSTAADHHKDFKKDLTQITFPELMIYTAPIYPLRWGKKSASKYWYQDISFKHTSEFKNQLTNVVAEDTLEFSRQNWPIILKDGKYGIRHTFLVEKNINWRYFNLKPFAEYTERWYFKRYNYTYEATEDSIVADTVESFHRVWDYKLGAALATTVYGTHFFNEENFFQAIRHRIEPSCRLTYNPGFLDKKYGYYKKLQTKKGEQIMDRFNGSVYGTPKSKASAPLEVTINNILEAKIRNSEDASRKSKKIPILESLYGKTSYDFLADSFPLADLQFGARNRFFDSLINVEYNTKYDPYLYTNRRRVEEFAWQHGRGLGIMKEYTFKIGTHLQSKKYNVNSPPLKNSEDEKTSEVNAEEGSSNKEPQKEETLVVLDSTQYIDFDTPWQLDINYQQNFTYNIPTGQKTTTRQIAFNGDLNITKNWKIGFSSVYDIDKKELVGSATKVGIYRDLHCWQMSFDWVPIADKQSYEFSIGLKAQMLEDVKLPHSREYDKV
jgi:hypothetical protein